MKIKAFKNNIFWMKNIFYASKARLFLNILVTMLQAVFNFIFDVYIFIIVIDGSQNGKNYKDICFIILLICLAQTMFIVLKSWYENVYVPKSDLKINTYMRKQVYDKLKMADLYCYDDPDFYNGYVKAMGEIDSRARAFLDSVSTIVNNVFLLLSTSFVIISISPVFFVIALVPLFISFFIGKAQGKARFLYSNEMKMTARKEDYIRKIFYSKDYSEEIRTTGIVRLLLTHFHEVMDDFKTSIKKHGYQIAFFDYLDYLLMDGFVFLGATAVAVFKAVVSKSITISGALIVTNTISSVSWAIRNFSDVIVEFEEHAMYIDNFISFMNREMIVNDDCAKLIPKKDSESIEVRNLYFTYPGNEIPMLKNITMDIHKGQKIAILGPNGAGKTTLVNVLLRYYMPDSGLVKLDGEELSLYYALDYRKSIGTVFQDYRLFAFSVLENLMLKKQITKEDRERAYDALEKSNLLDDILELPEGIETGLTKEFNENGAVLSNGQLQRLAISRLFANSHKFLFVDEPTSALDPVSEYKIFRSIIEYSEDKAVVFISHRLSTAVLADKVYYMEGGRIVEAGTHKKLLAMHGKYSAFWDKQVQMYERENKL